MPTPSNQTLCQIPLPGVYQQANGSGRQLCLPRGCSGSSLSSHRTARVYVRVNSSQPASAVSVFGFSIF